MATRRKSMSIQEEDAFVLTFDELMDEIAAISSYQDMAETIEWLRRVVCYNVPGGKQIRGRGVVAAYRALVGEPDANAVKETYVLGWCIEIFQACFLIANDIIDNAETRRGRLCWYLVDKIGDLAINDSMMLSSVMNLLLDRHFYTKPYYSDLVELFHDVHLKTSFGQCMDIQCSKKQRLSEFTIGQYKKIVKYKTCYHSFYLPVACAMVMANRTDKDDWKATEELVLEIGLLFQVQDDYLDCFGNPKVTGKAGSDIPENKCSWLIVKAYEKADDRQKNVLKENYGKGQESTPLNEKKVKEVYDILGLRVEYHKFEEECYKSICEKISKLSNKLPTTIFAETADVIYHRNK